MPMIYLAVIPLVVWGVMLLRMHFKTPKEEEGRRYGLAVASIACYMFATAFLQAEYLPSWPDYSVPLLAVGIGLLWGLLSIPRAIRELKQLERQKSNKQ